MEKTLQLNVEPIPKSVRAKQTIAAVLFMIPCILGAVFFLDTLLQGLLGIEYYNELGQVSLGWRLYILTFHYGPEIISFIILLTLASNKTTKIATLLFIMTEVILYFGVGIVGLGLYFTSFVLFLRAYAFSLIITNNKEVINNQDKAWMYLFCIILVSSLLNLITQSILELNQISWSDFLSWNSYRFSDNFLNIGLVVFNLCINILLIISMFYVVRCGAFNGISTNEVQPQANYSPLNKYMLGTVIGCVVGAVLLAIIYGNVDAINELASNF